MCRIYDLKHVCCGCVHHSINIIPCRSMGKDTQKPCGKIQLCSGQKEIVERPYEGLPCCQKCYPAKKAWVQKQFEGFEGTIEAYEKTGLYTTGEITRALKGGKAVSDWVMGVLDTPQKESRWDGCMDEVRFRLKLGARSYDVLWEWGSLVCLEG